MQNENVEPDAGLIGAYQKGDVEALGRLVERYRKPLFRFILGMIGSVQEAEEIFQEVWFRAIKGIGKYRDGRFLSWLYKIARNYIIDRSRAARKTLSLDKSNDVGVELVDTLSSNEPTPAVQAGNADSGRKIMEAVMMLPPEQREVFLMRVNGNLPFKEIARLQQVSINTALARMQYSLVKLKSELKEEYSSLERT